jgi:hypothetical protein
MGRVSLGTRGLGGGGRGTRRNFQED